MRKQWVQGLKQNQICFSLCTPWPLWWKPFLRLSINLSEVHNQIKHLAASNVVAILGKFRRDVKEEGARSGGCLGGDFKQGCLGRRRGGKPKISSSPPIPAWHEACAPVSSPPPFRRPCSGGCRRWRPAPGGVLRRGRSSCSACSGPSPRSERSCGR